MKLEIKDNFMDINDLENLRIYLTKQFKKPFELAITKGKDYFYTKEEQIFTEEKTKCIQEKKK
jgi:hypothetical protein